MAENTKNKVDPNLEEVEVTFPKIRGTKDQEIIIIVNGKAWQIQRGKQVKVPRYGLKVYDNSERSRDEADKYVMANAGEK